MLMTTMYQQLNIVYSPTSYKYIDMYDYNVLMH